MPSTSNTQRRLATDELIAEIKRGSDAALEKLYDRFQSSLEDFVRFRLPRRPPADAEDICIEVWHAAREAIRRNHYSCRPNATFKTWLFTIARNKCLNHIRDTEHLDANVPIETENGAEIEGIDYDSHSPFISPDHNAELGLIRDLLLAISDELPRAAEAWYLVNVEGCDQREVAALLGVAGKTIGRDCRRVGEILRARCVSNLTAAQMALKFGIEIRRSGRADDADSDGKGEVQ